ncbi:response regulator [Noviherbaspirillum aridicola]|uniref:Two-component system response regulator n=1 Tax=Noviherbaspirillum aridicola TaxID=2849687 RepID=A0ABQ4Q9K7_9BURK|nr:two-component system response regulator [Noviherbaspirillum aridicola]
METRTINTRALVVEDNQDFARLLGDILEIHGCEVHIRHTGRAGLELARALKPSIIFCDLNLGSMSGLDVAREMRQDPELSEIPLVAITGYVSDDDRSAAIAAGFNLVFPKPFRYADITRALNTYTAGLLK